MPLLQQLFARFSARPEQAQSDHRLARVSRKAGPQLVPSTLVREIEALEEECAEPLYEISVYVSAPQDPRG